MVFDDRLLDYCIQHLKGDLIDVSGDPAAIQCLRLACEAAKKELSLAEEAKVRFDWFYGETYEVPITRQKYNELINDYIQETMKCVQLCIQDANLQKAQIDEIVLVGGSTKNTIVKTTLESYFGKAVNISIDPIESGKYHS